MLIKNPLTLPLIGAILYMLKGNEPMTIFSPCSDLQTRQIKWISRNDQLKNGSRPSAYIHWGLPATVIAAQYAEVHSSIVK
jgi:hypothetical protein